MAGKSNALAELFLNLIFRAQPDPSGLLCGDPGTATSLWIALCTADPGDAVAMGDPAAHEVAYDGYARVEVSRNTGFSVVVSGSGGAPAGASQIKFNAPVTFPQSGGSDTTLITCTHAVITDTASGAGRVLYSGVISPTIQITANTAGIVPQFTTASFIQES